MPQTSSSPARRPISRASADLRACRGCRRRSSSMAEDITLAELLVVAASEAWRGNGEGLASGIGVVPRLAASLAKLTHPPELKMTDAEAFLVEEPVPLGPRGGYRTRASG